MLLGSDIKFSSDNENSYLTTYGEKPFIISNNDGAGILFDCTAVDENSTTYLYMKD
jgi:hypothetical protein